MHENRLGSRAPCIIRNSVWKPSIPGGERGVVIPATWLGLHGSRTRTPPVSVRRFGRTGPPVGVEFARLCFQPVPFVRPFVRRGADATGSGPSIRSHWPTRRRRGYIGGWRVSPSRAGRRSSRCLHLRPVGIARQRRSGAAIGRLARRRESHPVSPRRFGFRPSVRHLARGSRIPDADGGAANTLLHDSRLSAKQPLPLFGGHRVGIRPQKPLAIEMNQVVGVIRYPHFAFP